ncbi:MAG: amylo-alpha-1,6-glucosidase [Nanoarchaeota archaeon]
MIEEAIVNEGYKKAIEILKKNSTKIGFSASTEKHANYYSIWARDHSICAIAAVLSKDKELIETAKKGILLLLRNQADFGQIPSYVELENKKKVYGGLGNITSVDSNLWVVIAAAFIYKETKDKRFVSDKVMLRYKKIYTLLKSFDSNSCGLIEMPPAGDWADIFDRTYHVLYDEVLYYQALKDLLFLFKYGIGDIQSEDVNKKIKKRIKWVGKRKPYVKRRINYLFWLTKDNTEKIYEEYMIFDPTPKETYPFYQSHLMPFKHNWAKRFDSFGNILAMATKIANKKRSKKIIKHITKNKINLPVAIRALYPVVYKHERDWQSIYSRKERPHTYHNGGIWPLITGFWIYVLNKNNHPNIAKRDMINLADHLEKTGWKFHEYFHGKTLKPMGRTEQAWSAAGYIIGYHSFNHNMCLFNN